MTPHDSANRRTADSSGLKPTIGHGGRKRAMAWAVRPDRAAAQDGGGAARLDGHLPRGGVIAAVIASDSGTSAARWSLPSRPPHAR